ncbi:polymeric immunoglobulin receptor [Sorex fumeus]|uniref:polymeric immunoglobulin receptor n=1 Tax=Sorex fumeus TaxID=62283 RepID=UPI0024AE6AD9|nr:polymeric immunoglobulin receptor [Sorex fumeus]
MMLFFLSCLLAVFPAVSTKSPIFGPQDISREEGGSASIKCFYPATNVNKHTRKYWCRQGPTGSCVTLISSPTYVSKDYEGRAKLTDFPESNYFVVEISGLTKDESGLYKCGLGNNNRGLSFDVNLKVDKAVVLPDDTEVYKADLSENLQIDCPFSRTNFFKKKSVCKKTDQDQECIPVIDSENYINPAYGNRVALRYPGGTGGTHFIFVINQLQLTDTGIYVCQAGDLPDADKKNFYLQVPKPKPEPELAYGDLRGSVIIDCNLDPSVANDAKFLCKKNNEKGCNVVVNTMGVTDQAFQGRVLLTPKDKGSFSVTINGLRKEDAGHYLCGASSYGEPQEGKSTQAWQLFVNEESTVSLSSSVVKGVEGGSVDVHCPYNPRERNSVKSLCRWEDGNNCQVLVQSDGLPQEQIKTYQGRLSLNEESRNGIYTVKFNQLTTKDAGFYWCQTNGDRRRMSVVELKVVEAPKDISQMNAVPGEKAVESNVRETENKAIPDADLVMEDRALEGMKNPVDGSSSSTDTGSSAGQGGSTTVLVSTLVPLALVLAVGAVALGVARARHRRNVDRISIRSYKTDISMSDLENPREFGANDNPGASPFSQETPVDGNNEFATITDDTMETMESKEAKRSSKEEADMAYTNFVLQSNNIAANVQDRPSEV